jgi:hypothetical protein
MMKDRAAGVLLGQRCGDALSVRYEFGTPTSAGLRTWAFDSKTATGLRSRGGTWMRYELLDIRSEICAASIRTDGSYSIAITYCPGPARRFRCIRISGPACSRTSWIPYTTGYSTLLRATLVFGPMVRPVIVT